MVEIVVGLVLCFPAAVVWLVGGGPADVVVVRCGVVVVMVWWFGKHGGLVGAQA